MRVASCTGTGAVVGVAVGTAGAVVAVGAGVAVAGAATYVTSTVTSCEGITNVVPLTGTFELSAAVTTSVGT